MYEHGQPQSVIDNRSQEYIEHYISLQRERLTAKQPQKAKKTVLVPQVTKTHIRGAIKIKKDGDSG